LQQQNIADRARRRKVEERKQRNDQRPGQEGRSDAAIGIAGPENAEDQILDRDEGNRLIPLRPPQDEGINPERHDRGEEYPEAIIHFVVQNEMEIERDRVAEQRPEGVAQHEHPRAAVRVGLNLQPGRNEIIEEGAQAEFGLGLVFFLMVTAAAFHFLARSSRPNPG
jgi:hypothetical protein